MKYKQIEFYGLPGSGKTTLLKQLCSELEKNGIIPCSQWKLEKKQLYREWLSWRGLCYSIGCFILCLHKDLKEKEDYIFWKGMCGKFSTLRALYYTAENNEVILIDHGMIQGLSSLLHRSYCKEKYLKWYLKEIDKSFKSDVLYIYLCIDEESSYDRMKKREKAVRLLQYKKETALQIMKEMNKMYEKVHNHMQNKNCGIKIDSSKDITICINQILEKCNN